VSVSKERKVCKPRLHPTSQLKSLECLEDLSCGTEDSAM